MLMRFRIVSLLAVALVAWPVDAQKRVVTAEDYAKAERFLSAATGRLAYSIDFRPTWISGTRFWYRNYSANGYEFLVVDAAAKTRTRAFDHERIATALGTAVGQTYLSTNLPFTSITLADDGKTMTVNVGTKGFRCEVNGASCSALPATAPTSGPPISMSPDGKRGVFIRDYNLWMRDLTTGRETQLTTDGVKHFGYATDNAGWVKSDRAIVVWSADSKKIATFQQDERNVGEMYLVTTNVGHPELKAWKYPLPGDSVIQMIHRVIIDLTDGSPKMIRLKLPPDAHRSTVCDHIVCDGKWADVQWSDDATQLAFVSSSRDHKEARLRIANASTGDVRDVMEEKVATQFESGKKPGNWRVFFKTNELIWYSERSDYGQLYMYDLVTGKLKHPITTGEGPVMEVLRYDESSRTLWFLGYGREKGRDPYFRHVYKVGFDGKGSKLLTPEDADHAYTLSPDGKYIADSYSTATQPPVSILRDADGNMVMQLEKGDISKLLEYGWKPPVPFSAKGRDGKTDIYGIMYLPRNLEPGKKYPVIDNIYPGPQSGSVGARTFSVSRGDAQALNELGFIVVAIDGMGTPNRSKSFHDAWYGNMGDNTLPDQITAIKQLAEKYPIDLERVGITGGSGGGFATVDALLRYPDFFKVGVSSSGNHDNRNYEDDWGERYQGLLVRNPDGTTNYDNQANQLLAKNLKGKLLITHGGLDSNVPPYNTLLVVDALISANKTFDMIIFPNGGHGYGSQSTYMMRRKWDYFVEHLLGATPPKDYEFKANP
jgi:dipeptidyl-peptidase 4